MASKPRSKILFDECTTHKVWRAHNKEWMFSDDTVKEKYLKFLRITQKKIYIEDHKLNAICIMSNHTHEMFKIKSHKNFSHSMRVHHSLFGVKYNKDHKRSGKVAERRPHTTAFETDRDSKEAVFYIHANPMRAGLKDERAYKWSTHLYFAYGKKPDFLEEIKFEFPKWYMDYGSTMEIRQRKYRKEFQAYMERSKTDGYTKFSKVLFVGSKGWEEDRTDDITEYFNNLSAKRKVYIAMLEARINSA